MMDGISDISDPQRTDLVNNMAVAIRRGSLPWFTTRWFHDRLSRILSDAERAEGASPMR